jgi:N-acetylglucosamine-6-phosphate deacetylase
MKTIDIHMHGIGGFDTRTKNVKNIIRMAEIEASCGVSEIIPTIYPDSIQVMRENMTAVKMAMEMQKPDDDRCATIRGVHLEGPFLNPGRCGALNSSSFVEPTEYHLKELLEGFEDMVKIITIAPELNGAAKLIRKISEMGIIVSMGHSDATYSEAEAGFNAGAKGITHLFNAMRGFHHREPGIIGFGLLNKEVYIEVIADPYHLNIKTLELIFRTKNPERIILISDSVKGTKISEPEKDHGVVDDTGRLQGGSMSIMESSRRLTELGFNEVIAKNSITKNPETYLFELT